MIHFYAHLVETSEISLSLAEMEMTNSQRRHLLLLVESSLHNSIVDLVLAELGPNDQKIFLGLLYEGNTQGIHNLLKENVADVEKKIRVLGKKLVAEFLQDITSSGTLALDPKK